MKLVRTLALALVAAPALFAPTLSCGGAFENSCVKSAPFIAQGNALVNDAQEALLQAEAAVSFLRDDAVKAKALAAIEVARKELRTAEGLLNAASQACSAPDLPSIFKAFADAWSLVRPFLGTAGGAGAAEVADPIAYTIK